MRIFGQPVAIRTLLSALLLGGFLVVNLYRFSMPMPPPHQGDPLDLRGTNIVALRIVNHTAFEEIRIQETGAASRVPIPLNNAVDTVTWITLPISEQQDIQTFREAWCQGRFRVRTISPDEPFYDLAVRCPEGGIQQTKITPEALPPILLSILRRVPSLPQRPVTSIGPPPLTSDSDGPPQFITDASWRTCSRSYTDMLACHNPSQAANTALYPTGAIVRHLANPPPARDGPAVSRFHSSPDPLCQTQHC